MGCGASQPTPEPAAADDKPQAPPVKDDIINSDDNTTPATAAMVPSVDPAPTELMAGKGPGALTAAKVRTSAEEAGLSKKSIVLGVSSKGRSLVEERAAADQPTDRVTSFPPTGTHEPDAPPAPADANVSDTSSDPTPARPAPAPEPEPEPEPAPEPALEPAPAAAPEPERYVVVTASGESISVEPEAPPAETDQTENVRMSIGGEEASVRGSIATETSDGESARVSLMTALNS